MLGKQIVDGDLVIHDVMNVFGTRVVILQQNLEIKNDAVIDAGVVVRVSAVQRAVRDENDVAFPVDAGIIVQGQMKGAGDNSDDFVMSVPVIRHIVTGAVRHFMIKSNRKVKSPLLSLLLIIKIFHLTAVFPFVVQTGEYCCIFLYYITFIFFRQYL